MRTVPIVLVSLLAISLFGCSERTAPAVAEAASASHRSQPASPDRAAQSASPAEPTAPTVSDDPAADPVGYLRRVAQKASALTQYRVTFIRQERLGVIPELKKKETIAATFRAEPFSVHFEWLDADSEYLQAAFVRGVNGDKVLLLPRNGLLGLPPTVGKFNPQDAVTFQKARNPITDFGLARMMERTLKRIADAERGGGARVEYKGIEPTGSDQRPAHRIAIALPKSDPYTNKQMDLFIDQQTELPLGAYLHLPDGKLDAMYLYEGIQPDVAIGPDDFAIREGKATKVAGRTRTASAEHSSRPALSSTQE